ncbi:MAG TPA: GAF domain-containing protein [Anaerolineae bacterium]|nr:GAF domain-containing protein [Anaerolineae bacterium]HQH37063.1 GAF domain-containing protein [Anaerolineae bacterium]
MSPKNKTQADDRLDSSLTETSVGGEAAAATQALQDLEARYAFLRQLLDLNPNFFFVRDREGRFVFANKALADAYGTTVEALIGKTDADFNANLKEVEAIRQSDLEVMESLQERFIAESPILRKGRWMQTTKLPIVDAQGVAQQVLGISADITERVQMEETIRASLERRGRQVQTVTEVAQEIASATALDELFRRVVTLVKERFGYYHAQIFRYDAAARAMRLVSGYGVVGQRMLAAGHYLPMGRGVVGTAAATGRPVLASDVTRDPDWVPNTFLPATRGELAVPIKLRDQVLGVLDVQSNVTGALTTEDQLLLEGLCGQIAIAIQSTQLLESANTFRQVIESSGQGICMATLEGVLTYANPAYRALVGLTDPETLPGQPFLAHYPEILQGRVREEIMPEVLAKGQWQGELALLSASGEVIPTLDILTLVRDEQGEPRYLVRQVTDITARKAMEDALATERQLLHALLDNVPDHIYFKDAESRFIRISSANARWLNLENPSQALGKTDFDFFGAEHAEKAYADERHILATGQPMLDMEEKEVWPDGHETWVSTSKMPLRDTEGRIVGTFGISTDITARKLAEIERDRALRNIEVQSQQLSNTLTDMTRIQETMAALTAALTFEEAVNILLSSVVAAVQADRVSMFLINNEHMTRVGLYPGAETQRAQIGEALPLSNYPLTRQVVETRRPRVVAGDSPELQEHERRAFAAAGIVAQAMVPLIGREGVVGLLAVNLMTSKSAFTDHDVQILQMLADQTALAIENIRLLERTRVRAERERLVRTVIDRIRRGTDRDAIMRTTLQELVQMLDASKAVMRLGNREQLLSAPGVSTSAYVYAKGVDGLRTVAGDDRALELAALVEAVTQAATVAKKDPAEGQTLALPVTWGGETIGVLGFTRPFDRPLDDDEIAAVEEIVEQAALALENQRLFDETQRARALLSKQIRELDCLNDIGRKIAESPAVPDLLQWTAERIPAAMQYAEVCIAVIEYAGQFYGNIEAIDMARQMVNGLRSGDEEVGRVVVAYTEDHVFLDGESALLGDISRRLTGYIENRQLLEQTEARAVYEQALLEIAGKIGTSEDMEGLLASLSETIVPLRRLAPVDWMSVAAYTPGESAVTIFTVPLEAEVGPLSLPATRLAVENSAPGWVITHQKPWIEADMRQKMTFPEDADWVAAGIVSRLLLPLQFGDQLVGTLNMGSRQPRAFTQEHGILLGQLANQLAQAMERTRLLQNTRAALAAEAETHRSYERREWQTYLQENRKLRQNTFVYDAVTQSATDADQVAVRPDFWRPEMVRSLREAAPVTTYDEVHAAPMGDGEPAPTTEKRSGLAIPIEMRGQVIGVLGVEDPEGRWRGSPDQLALIQSVAQQLGQALESARLLEATQRRAAREQRAREITDTIRAAPTIEDAVKRAIQEIAHVLNASETVARLGTENLLTPREEGETYE